MRAAKWIIIALGTLSLLLWLARVEENWRGQSDWQNCKREVEAKGISLNWNDYIPPPVPDDQNFFKAPKMQEWFVENWRENTNELSQQFRDKKYDQITSSVGTPKNLIQSADAAKDFIAWSDKFEPDFNLIREAVKRPYARIDGNYSDPLAILIPNFVNFRLIVQTLAQRAHCYLILNQPDNALRELTLLNDLRRTLNLSPSGKPMTLVTAMINNAIAGLYASTIADDFPSHSWQEPQLATLQEQLRQINLLPLLVNAIHTENASHCHLVETYLIPKSTKTRSRYLTGWLLENLVTITTIDQKAAESVDLKSSVVSPRKLVDVDREIAAVSKHPYLPDRILANIAIPNFTKAWQAMAYDQTLISEAQIACALEHYRQDHGEYPETLSALTPQFIETIPHDLIGGQPLHYRRTNDGKFLLYSIGWNELDDGGKPSPQDKYGGIEYTNGDWVWPN